MSAHKSKSGKRSNRMGGKRRGRRNTNNVVGGPNTARITETYDLSGVLINNPEEYFFEGIPAGSRAAEIAPSFGLYRIAKVTYSVKPLYDTYIPGQPGLTGNALTTVPQLYWKINRYGDAPPVFNSTFLKEQGAKAIRLDDKTITISYKPNILLADAGAVAQGLNGGSGQVKMTPWLSTDSETGDNQFALSQTLHYGHLMFVEGDTLNNSTQPQCAHVEVKVVWEFKNPRGTASTQANAPAVVKKMPVLG